MNNKKKTVVVLVAVWRKNVKRDKSAITMPSAPRRRHTSHRLPTPQQVKIRCLHLRGKKNMGEYLIAKTDPVAVFSAEHGGLVQKCIDW